MRRIKFELYLSQGATGVYYEAPTRSIAMGMVEQEYTYEGKCLISDFRLVKVQGFWGVRV